MMRYRCVPVLVFIGIFFSGCYESEYPLGDPGASRIDERLLKSWVEEPENTKEKPVRAAIYKFDAREYCIAFSPDNETATVLRAFTALFDKVPVINLQCIESEKPSERTFLYLKYAFSQDGTLQTWLISRDSPLLMDKKFSSPGAFTAYIKKHIHDPRLFGDMRRFKPVERLQLNFQIPTERKVGQPE